MNWYQVGALILALVVLSILGAARSEAACRYTYVDDDWDSATPAIWAEICDDYLLDSPAFEPVQPVEPIQSLRIQPLDTTGLQLIAPIGASDCEQVLSWDDSSRKWREEIVCR